MRDPTRLRHLGPAIALAALGFAIVLVWRAADPGPRISSRERLVDLIAIEDRHARELRAELEELRLQLEALERRASLRDADIAEVRATADGLRVHAGLAALEGPGVVVELRDSSLRESPTGDPNDLVIHEQDLQAVVNGLWRAGAEAISINGERVTATSAVRCVGNTLLLHGSVYSPPYRVAAIGDPEPLLAAMTGADPLVERFRVFAAEFRLGFTTTTVETLEMPAFAGGHELQTRFAKIA